MSKFNKASKEERMKQRRQQVFYMKLFLLGSFLFITVIVILAIIHINRAKHPNEIATSSVESQITTIPYSDVELPAFEDRLQGFINSNAVSLNDYPENLLALAEKNPETEEFVLNYALLKDTYSTDDLTEALDQEMVPLLMQWDSRWGYYPYSGDLMGVMGCGPVCLSMVAIHLLQDPSMTPIYIADYAVEEGYCTKGHGTAWDLMDSGAKGLGLYAEEVPLDENIIKRHLENGKPIICIVGAGDFTVDGHFLVFADVEDGYIILNDPNSKERSQKRWTYEELAPQIRNMWVYTVP